VAAARQVQHALGLIGWVLPWATERDARGDLRFELSRPGKRYRIHVDGGARVAHVEEHREGLGAVIRALHGLREVPGSRFLRLWGVFTEVTTLVVLFSAVTGVYLWLTRRTELRAGWLTLAAATVLSLALVLYVWLRG
jgi:hypothetical protein